MWFTISNKAVLLLSLIWFLIIWGFFFSGAFPTLPLLLVFYGLCVLVIFLLLVKIQPQKTTLIDFKKLNKEYASKDISTMYFFALLNRMYFFPWILTLYLIYLLIQQTQLRWRNLERRFLMLNEQVLLLLTILSGLFLVYKQEKDRIYQVEQHSSLLAIWYIWLSIFLWLITIIIINKQVSSLESVWRIIALLSWILVFLVGVLLMEEDISDKKELI